MFELIQAYGMWIVFLMMMGGSVWTFANMSGRSGDGCCSETLKGTTKDHTTAHAASQGKHCCH